MASARWFPCVVGLAAALLAGLGGALYVGLTDGSSPGLFVPPGPLSGGMEAHLPEAESYPRLSAARDAVARELLAGRIDLLQAAARFHVLNVSRPDGGRLALVGVVGESEAEKLCRQTIRWAFELLLEEAPSEAGAARQRLEEELERHLRGGPIQLSAPPPQAAPAVE